MHRLSSTYRLVCIIIVSLLVAGSTMRLSATPINNAIIIEHNNGTTPSTTTESHIEAFSPTLGLSSVTYSSEAIAPIVRTLPRTTRQLTRLDSSTMAVRSIDSTQAKSRAGLFNHKILFFTHPRHYYLNGLVRLII